MTSRKPAVLVTGANGEIGHSLVRRLAADGANVVALDVREIDAACRTHCTATQVGDINDLAMLQRLGVEFEFTSIFHLAALLSTRGEFQPELAHRVNVEGTLNLMRVAVESAANSGYAVTFMFPSSIAVYGIADTKTRASAPPVSEEQYLAPQTMYGCNKLYGEHLGRYTMHHYRRLAAEQHPTIDFRSIRFPGLISADTVPSGGTSDYAPEMLHAAAKGEPYACFVRENMRLPFMAMPDAVDALLQLAEAPKANLSTHVYNIGAFAPSAAEFATLVREFFPKANISFKPDLLRQAIVESWPADVDDTRARRDWGFKPLYDLRRTFSEYLIPGVRRRYGMTS
ncbi:MAG: NAD-dependent epimerase/dehydratase family protein [Planctomycetes bacterium]|nr:NAD-dependent epimerase/dehydratase family protein [Planctomycetota bacterium]